MFHSLLNNVKSKVFTEEVISFSVTFQKKKHNKTFNEYSHSYLYYIFWV